MTLDWIIERLGISGCGTKQEVLNRLKNMTLDELQELSNSVEKKLEEMKNDKARSVR